MGKMILELTAEKAAAFNDLRKLLMKANKQNKVFFALLKEQQAINEVLVGRLEHSKLIHDNILIAHRIKAITPEHIALDDEITQKNELLYNMLVEGDLDD